jgi:hypothetical protein
MKIWATILVIVAVLAVAELNYCMFVPPGQVLLLFVLFGSGAPGGEKDPNVYLAVRNCGSYAHRSGFWWWERAQVDFKACTQDPAARGPVKVVAQLQPDVNLFPGRVVFTFACPFCRQGRLVHAVKIPLGANPEDAAHTLKLPLDIRLEPDQELQLVYTPKAAGQDSKSVVSPVVE